MKAIFHLHTSYSGDSFISISFLLNYCIKKGISYLFITEHNNMDSYPLAKRMIEDKKLPITLIPCEEIATKEGEVIGIFLKKVIPKGLSLEETIKEIKSQGALLAVPHPFDSIRKERIKDKSHLGILKPHLDFVEVFNARSRPKDNKKAKEWAREHHINPIFGADAHFKRELGNCILDIPAFDSPQSLLKAMQEIKVLSKRRSYFGVPQSGLLKYWRRHFARR